LRAEISQSGKRLYVIPTGGSNATGALGYALCAAELASQCEAVEIPLTDVLHATSSAGTQSGLLAGFTLLSGADTVRVHGINVSELPAAEAALGETISGLVDEDFALCDSQARLPTAAIRVDSAYLGRGYGLPTEATLAAVRRVAELEGILLDPVYSGKAMSGLAGKISNGEFDGVSNLIFLHTGGSASLPVYGQALRR
jgi:L-cysteate sulfo-lyase